MTCALLAQIYATPVLLARGLTAKAKAARDLRAERRETLRQAERRARAWFDHVKCHGGWR